MGSGNRPEGFLRKIHHDRIMNRLRNIISDKKLLKLIHQFLQAGIMQGGVETQLIASTPQARYHSCCQTSSKMSWIKSLNKEV